MAEPDRADLARKATAGLVAINSAKSCSACVEIKITGGVAPGVLRCSSSTKSKPHSLPRSISTSVTSGCNVSTRLSPSEHDRATPITSIPWRSSNRAAASRKSALSSTITHRNRSPMDTSSVWRDEVPAACPLAGSRVLHPSGSLWFARRNVGTVIRAGNETVCRRAEPRSPTYLGRPRSLAVRHQPQGHQPGRPQPPCQPPPCQPP